MFVHPSVCSYAPHMFVHPLYICMPPWGCTPPPGAPTCFCAPAWFWHFACCGGVVFLYWDTPPLFGGTSPLITPRNTPLLVLCALLFSGISVLMWAFPLLLKGLGVFPHHWGRFGVAHQLFSCSHTHSVTLFCSALCLMPQPRL